jgi:hypothetical protein
VTPQSPALDEELQPPVSKPSFCNTQDNHRYREVEPSREPTGSVAASPPSTSAPCKLLTRLSANPTLDVSQILASCDNGPETENAEDGIPCSSAYKLLMSYASSEDKLDSLAHVLEEGCVPNADGGCRLKNKTISQALLDICL